MSYHLPFYPIKIKHLGLVHYSLTDKAMHEFTANRTEETEDEIWVVEHPSVFTQGRAGKAEHILGTTEIEIIQSDRGGQVTYHGPGQLILYPLINLKKRQLSIRQFVSILEISIIDTLLELGILAYARADAPGVYTNLINPYAIQDVKLEDMTQNHTHKVATDLNIHQIKEAKICSLGLRVSRGYTMHGLALNVDMDLTPFEVINPCGLIGMQMTSIADLLSPTPAFDTVSELLLNKIKVRLTNL